MRPQLPHNRKDSRSRLLDILIAKREKDDVSKHVQAGWTDDTGADDTGPEDDGGMESTERPRDKCFNRSDNDLEEADAELRPGDPELLVQQAQQNESDSHRFPSNQPGGRLGRRRSQVIEHNEQRWWENIASSNIKKKDRFKQAALYIKDAIHGREIRWHRHGKWPRRVYYFCHHWALQMFLFTVLTCHLLLALFEPPSHDSDETYPCFPYEFLCHRSTVGKALLWTELGFVLMYTMHVALKAYAHGPNEFIHNLCDVLKLFCILLMWVDIILALVLEDQMRWLRFSRPLRPILFVAYGKMMQSMLHLLIAILPQIAQVAMLVAGYVLMFAVISTQIVHTQYSDIQYDDSFKDTGQAFVTSYVLLTTENFPMALFNAVSQSGWYYVLFIPYEIVGLYIVINLVVPILYDAYQHEHKLLVVEERIRERKALLAAFQVMDPRGRGNLTMHDWTRLIAALRPKEKPEHIRLLFNVIDRDSSGTIDLLEFFDVCDVLQLDITKRDPKLRSPSIRRPVPRGLGLLRLHLSQSEVRSKLRQFFRSKWYRQLLGVMVPLNVLVMCLYGSRAFGAPWSPQQRLVLYVADKALLALYVAELVLRMFAFHWRKFALDGWNIYDMVICIAAIVEVFIFGVPSVDNSIQIVRVLRLVLFISFSKSMQDHFFLALNTIPYLARMACFLLMIFYIYVIIGMEAFCMAKNTVEDETSSYDYDGYHNFLIGMLTQFQLLTESNWHTVMYNNMARVDSWWVALLFISFNFLAEKVMLSLVLACFLDAFHAARDLKRQNHHFQADVAEVNIPMNTPDSNKGARSSGPERIQMYTIRRHKRWERLVFENQLEDLTMDELSELMPYTGNTDLGSLYELKRNTSVAASSSASRSVSRVPSYINMYNSRNTNNTIERSSTISDVVPPSVLSAALLRLGSNTSSLHTESRFSMPMYGSSSNLSRHMSGRSNASSMYAAPPHRPMSRKVSDLAIIADTELSDEEVELSDDSPSSAQDDGGGALSAARVQDDNAQLVKIADDANKPPLSPKPLMVTTHVFLGDILGRGGPALTPPLPFPYGSQNNSGAAGAASPNNDLLSRARFAPVCRDAAAVSSMARCSPQLGRSPITASTPVSRSRRPSTETVPMATFVLPPSAACVAERRVCSAKGAARDSPKLSRKTSMRSCPGTTSTFRSPGRDAERERERERERSSITGEDALGSARGRKFESPKPVLKSKNKNLEDGVGEAEAAADGRVRSDAGLGEALHVRWDDLHSTDSPQSQPQQQQLSGGDGREGSRGPNGWPSVRRLVRTKRVQNLRTQVARNDRDKGTQAHPRPASSPDAASAGSMSPSMLDGGGGGEATAESSAGVGAAGDGSGTATSAQDVYVSISSSVDMPAFSVLL